MQTVATRFNPVHKAAVSLNNTAVALLSKGFFREAMVTLKDSLHLMKMASQLEEKNLLSPEEEEMYLTSLHNAQRHSSVMMMSESNSAMIKSVSSQTLAYALFETSDDFFRQVPMPIFIEMMQDDDTDMSAGFDFECATILYNYGLSHSLLANASADNESTQFSLRHSALRCFQLAETILVKIDEQCDDDDMEYFEIQETMLLGALLMRSLVQVNDELNRAPSANAYRQALQKSLAFVQQQHRLCPVAHDHHAAPAA
jgi:hypothetical protein